MKAQNEVQKSDLFPNLSIIQDDIEKARAKMRGFANNPATITTQHLLARQNLLSALREGIPSDQNPSSTLNEIERIEGVLSELSEEIELNKNIRIDPDLRDSGDLESMTARINDIKQRISRDIDAAQRSPEIVAFIADQKRAQEQGEVNAQIKKGKLQILQDKIGLGFNNNSDHQKAINLIYAFNEAQGSAISQLSDEKEIKAIFNMLANHPEVIGDRSPNDVIESAREGYKIVHNALNLKGRVRNMGNWTAEEPKIMDKLLPKLCVVNASQLKDSAAKITAEYAESIWANANYSAAAVAGGARSIADKGLNLVSSKTLNAVLGQPAEDKLQQRGVLQEAYEAARKAVPNPFARRAASSAPTTPEPEAMPAPPEPQQYQEECALAAQLFESAMTNTIELQTLAENGCFGLQGKIAGAVSTKELEELRAQVLHMRGLAEQAAGLVQEASDGVAEISLNVSGDLINIGAELEERLVRADQSATHILSAEDLFSAKPLPTTSLSEVQETQSSNDLTEGLQRARELQSISRNIEGLKLPLNAATALESINAVLNEAAGLLKSKIPELEAKDVEMKGKQTAEAGVAKPESRSLLSSLPSLPSFFRGRPASAEPAEPMPERLVAAKEEEVRNAEELALRANSWRHNPREKASAAASASAEAAGQYALEGLRGLSGGVTVVALTTAAESARLAKRYPKAAAAAGAVYGAAKIAMAIVAAAPYVAAAAATGAALRTETGRAVAGQMVEGAAIVGGAVVGVAVNNPKATGVVAGAVGVIGAGLALAAAAPYAAALAAANTKVGRKVVGAVAKGVKEGAAVSALAQLEGGVGSVAAAENVVDGARSVAATARQVGDTVRSFVGGEAAAGAPSLGSPEPSTPPRSRTSTPTGRS